MQRPFVLVVDDEEPNREMCREALQLNGYEVIMAAGPEEAEQILSTRDVDAIVCDVSMPHNGLRVYEYLLKNFPQLRGRFIFVTGNPAKKQQVERLPNGVPCLLKPFSIRVLLDTMRAALGA